LLYILTGADSYSRTLKYEEIKNGLGNQEALVTNTSIFDSDELTLDRLTTACNAIPFLAEKRLVVVKGLLGSFEPKDSATRQKKTRKKNGQQKEQPKWAQCINSIPESTVLILIEDEIKNKERNSLYKLIKKATSYEFKPLNITELVRWIKERVKQEGFTITPEAVSLLTRMVDNNLWTVSNEITKLVLYKEDKHINEEDVRTIVSYTHQDTVFGLVDAIIGSRSRTAEQLLRQLLERGLAPVYLLFMLVRQTRMIVIAKDMKRHNASSNAIKGRLGLRYDFQFNNLLQQSGQYSMERLKQVYTRLLETDVAIKTGQYDGELALSILIAELCQKSPV